MLRIYNVFYCISTSESRGKIEDFVYNIDIKNELRIHFPPYEEGDKGFFSLETVKLKIEI